MARTLKAGRYEVTGVLGAGAQGETLDARDTSNGQRVAVKRFSVRGAKSWKDVELAEREARVLSAITHPKLPRYIDHFEEDGALYLVMDLVEGESLAALKKRQGSLPRAELVRLLSDVGEVLDYLHGRAPPIIHRDIKPGNVIRKPDGSFSLVDFGSVRDSLKPEGGSTVVGTFGYMGPEQFQGRALPQSDVYALGATALSFLTGREPEDLPHRGLAIDVAQALPHDPAFARVLARMLEPDPDRRATRVAPLVAGLAPPPTHGSIPPGSVPPRGSARPGPPAPGSVPTIHPPNRKPLAPPLIAVLLILGLLVARFSTGVLFRVFLPVLLTLLSIFFGGGLRRTAARMRDVGQRGDEGIRHAMDIVRGGPKRRSKRPRHQRRMRVIDVEAEEDALDVQRGRKRQ
jgi:serine/threonine protein kinase